MKAKFTLYLFSLFIANQLAFGQVITRTYNEEIGNDGANLFSIDVDLDGTDDFEFENLTYDFDVDCKPTYVHTLHSNALLGTFNSMSNLAKCFDDGAIINDLVATFQYSSSSTSYLIRDQYLFALLSGENGFQTYAYIAFKLNGKFGYFYTHHLDNADCADPDMKRDSKLLYARYEDQQNTPITINATLAVEESLSNQLQITTVNNILTIHSMDGFNPVDLVITDIRGTILYTNSYPTHSIDMNNFSAGVYIFSLHKDGKSHIFKKIVSNLN